MAKKTKPSTPLSDELMDRLMAVAALRGQSVDEFLNEILEQYESTSARKPEEEPPVESLKRLVALGRRLRRFETSKPLTEQMDDFLSDEFAEFLTSRADKPPDEPKSDTT